MGKELYFEDFEIGQKLSSRRSYKIEKDHAIAFASEFDPQLQHTDEHAAKSSVFKELVVSGWHTAAVTMRLKTETDLFYVAGGLVGLGLESVRWPVPVRPEDTLRIIITILDKRISKSKPDKGIIRYQVETFNQEDVLVMEMFTSVIVPVRG